MNDRCALAHVVAVFVAAAWHRAHAKKRNYLTLDKKVELIKYAQKHPGVSVN